MLIPDYNQDIPETTVEIAQAAFPNGNSYLTLRDKLGTIFQDEDFIALFPEKGQPALAPWRLALVTILQFRENLTDRQAAEAVRSRIDVKYLLGLELTDPGFDFSVLSEFRSRLLTGKTETILLEKLLTICRELELVKPRGKQRTDATHVMAAIRVMNRLEQVGETMRAALNELATEAPLWLQSVAPTEWYKRYGHRIENDRLPQSKAGQEAYGQQVGEDGFYLLDLVAQPNAPKGLDKLAMIAALRLVWERHYEREGKIVRFKNRKELANGPPGLESPYDPEARFRQRGNVNWVGYIAHLSESCDDDQPHLITHVRTTTANLHEIHSTEAIHQALRDKGLTPGQHLLDSAYVDADLLVNTPQEYGITLIGPTRKNPSWQARMAGGYDRYQFDVDWDKKQVLCPQGKQSISWRELTDKTGPYIQIVFRKEDCVACQARHLCTRSRNERRMRLQPRPQFEALKEARLRHASQEGKRLYNKRAGVEGTISQGVRAFGLRKTRYRGLAKTHLQHIATAAAINLDRLVAWFDDIPRGKTRTSRFAALAPA
ncbi:MAG: IS5/IS1182 family transposase [Anaerolineaceae bacterium]|nr:IS5/IS1182 family transposase [Anaerolineaceae bacterium]